MSQDEKRPEELLDRFLERPIEPETPAVSSLAKREEELYQEERKQYISTLQKRVLKKLEDEGTGFSVDTKTRGRFTWWVFWLVILWLVAVLTLTVLSGIEGLGFQLSDTVLVTLIGAATANIVALLGTVIAYFFVGKAEANLITRTLVEKLMEL